MSKNIQLKENSDNAYPIAPVPAWTFVGRSTGQSAVSLPSSGWTELLIYIVSIKGSITYIIPRIALDSNAWTMYDSTYVSSTDFNCQSIKVSLTSVSYAEEYYYRATDVRPVLSYNDFNVYVR